MSIISFYRQDFQIERYARKKIKGGYGADGKWKDQGFTVLNMFGSIQPSSLMGDRSTRVTNDNGDQGGKYNQGEITVFTPPEYELFTTESPETHQADVVLYRGKRYEVKEVNAWLTGGIPHHESICLLIDNYKMKRR